MASEYRIRTVQCLVNSDYTKSDIYTIEALLLYVHGEYNSRWDAEVGIWVIVGMVVRLSMRMGYHRDPSKFSGVTPYQAEMRRRIWAFIRQMDTMFSFQLALPSMIRTTDCDTALPRNIFEDEFGPDSKILPPARPLTEPTPVSYMITKAQIAFEFGEILEELNAVNGKPVSYDDILKRDNRLRDLKLNMAPHLRLRPIEECTHDPATLLMQRFNIDIFWNKTMVVLHRKYISRARQNPRYGHSRRASVDASMEILRHQAQLSRESQPGGRMRTMKWFISSLTKHDFLLAAMIVCLDLHYDSVTEALPERPPHYDPYFWTPAQKKDMLETLQVSQEIWKSSSDKSMEAFKASGILQVVLDKLSLSKATQATDPPQSTAEAFAQFDDENLRPEHSAAMTLGMLSGGLTPNSAAMFNAMAQSPGGTRYNMDMNMADSTAGGSGLTPNYSSMDTSGAFGIPSPFGGFGSGNAGVMDGAANLDWVCLSFSFSFPPCLLRKLSLGRSITNSKQEAWDSYIQNGGAIDPAFQFLPMGNEPQMSPDGQQGGSNNSYGNNIFMGANTPR